MKILHVIHSVNPRGGGPIEGIRQFAPVLAHLGIASEVMSLDAPDAPWTANFPVPLFPTGPARTGYGYTPGAVPWLRQNRRNYDAIIVNGLWQYSGFAVWRAVRGTSTPYYVYPHGMLDPWFKRRHPLKHLKKWLYWPWGEYRVLRDAAGVLFTSEEERTEARKSFWLYRCREQVAGYGIAAPPGDPASQRSLFLEQFPALKGKRLILFLGRIHEKKGCDLLLHAWKETLAQSGPDFHLVMAGPADDAFGAEMKRLTRSLRLDPAVTWPGMLSGDLKWGAFHAAEAFVLPSHQENFGVSVVEALACGLPVLISNRVNIWREIEQAGASLVENDDLPGTVRLLGRWAALVGPEREKMEFGAKWCFATHFDIEGRAAQLAAILTH